jgi:hypothetical protein
MDDDYQQEVDYENEIYGLNYGIDQDSEEETHGEHSQAENDGGDDESDEDFSEPSPTQSIKAESLAGYPIADGFVVNGNLDDSHELMDDDDDSNLSEDERDMILSRLYHSTLPTSTVPLHTDSKSSQINDVGGDSSIINTIPNGISSTNFTFELDLDNLPSPPRQTTPLLDTTTLDEDGDFSVPPLPITLTLDINPRTLFRP